MTEILIMSVLTALAILIVMIKIDIRKFLGYEITVDLTVTCFLAALGAMTGTFMGLMTGIVAGLAFSLVIAALKKLLGYKSLNRKGWQEHRPFWRVSQEDLERARSFMKET